MTTLLGRAFAASSLAGFDPGFALGTLGWTSGANVGSHSMDGGAAAIALLAPPLRPFAAGDAFVIRPACDKRIETCGSRFASVANLRGFSAYPLAGSRASLCHAGRRARGIGALSPGPAAAEPARVVTAPGTWLGKPHYDQAGLLGVGYNCLGLARRVWREVVGTEPFPIPLYSRTGARQVPPKCSPRRRGA